MANNREGPGSVDVDAVKNSGQESSPEFSVLLGDEMYLHLHSSL